MNDVPDFIKLAVSGVHGLRPYEPGKPESEIQREYGLTDVIKLASNENPLGPSPRAVEAMQAQLGTSARYPDGNGFDLKARLASHHGVDMTQITLGNGSNDVLELIGRAYLAPGIGAVFSEHSFIVYPLVVQATGATPQVAKARDFGHDLEAMGDQIDETTRVIFIANPNNPTGTWLDGISLEAFIASVPRDVLVVVDEAYTEYVDELEFSDATGWLERYPNLIVTRTFSKAHALAGLRVGYALSHPSVADALNRIRQPFNTNSVAQAAAVASLDEPEHVARGVALNRRGMAAMIAACEELGLGYIPSVGNFLTVDFGRPAGPVFEALLRQGVITRPIGGYGLPNHLRITIGLEQENQRCIDAMRAVLND